MQVSKDATTIDLWFEQLDSVTLDDYLDYWSLLDHGERAKAKRFVRDFDRRRYVASHGKLRRILATYLQLSPDKIVFGEQVHGKPFILDDTKHGVKFNLAHSGGYLSVVVSHSYDLGVDIEVWTDTIDYEAVLALCFADAERRFWSSLPTEQKQEFFYRLWTRKESFVKAVGLGLELDVSQIETAPIKPSRFLSLPAGCGLPQSWSLTDLRLANGLSGAVTVPTGYKPKINYKRLA